MSAPTDGPQRSARATMRDVAALAGVSLKTVSRVVNDEPGVSPELRERVRSAVERLAYRHNLSASSLRRLDRRTATIGILLENIGDPVSSALHRAIEDVARRRGVVVFAASSDESATREHDAIGEFLARRVDGLIVMSASPDLGYLRSEIDAGTAVVTVDRPPAFLDVDCVVTDNREGAFNGTRHLAQQGHTRVAFLGDLPSIWTAAERRGGHIEAVRDLGLDSDPGLVLMGLHDAEAAAAAVGALIAQANPPTAILAAQNLLTMGTIQALRSSGQQHNVALVGFDDFPLADMLEPAISVVAQDLPAIGARAAELLFARMDGDVAPARREVMPSQLIVRGSGEIRSPR